MFLHLSVIQSLHRGCREGGCHAGFPLPPVRQQAAGTHPTRMNYCICTDYKLLMSKGLFTCNVFSPLFSPYSEMHSTKTNVYVRTTEILQRTRIFKAIYCTKVHNAHLKLAVPISG